MWLFNSGFGMHILMHTETGINNKSLTLKYLFTAV